MTSNISGVGGVSGYPEKPMRIEEVYMPGDGYVGSVEATGNIGKISAITASNITGQLLGIANIPAGNNPTDKAPQADTFLPPNNVDFCGVGGLLLP